MRSMSKIATVGIIDPFHPRVVELIRASLPPDWQLNVARGRSIEDHADALANAGILFVMATPVPNELLSRAPYLGFIQKLGAGVDRIDTDYCALRGIGLARLQAGNAIPVAEHTVLMMLAACRRLTYLDRQTRAGAWDKEASRGVNRQISGKTVGLVGFGAIGRQVARLLTSFDVCLLYYDPYPAPPEIEAALNATYCELDVLLAKADVVSLHTPLMQQTAGLIDARRISAMKHSAILVNCARGGLIDEAALHSALLAGDIFAAGLDTFASEPPVDSPLLTLDSTVVTPHVAGATIDNFGEVAKRAVGNAQRYLAGEALPPADVVIAPRRPAA